MQIQKAQRNINQLSEKDDYAIILRNLFEQQSDINTRFRILICIKNFLKKKTKNESMKTKQDLFFRFILEEMKQPHQQLLSNQIESILVICINKEEYWLHLLKAFYQFLDIVTSKISEEDLRFLKLFKKIIKKYSTLKQVSKIQLQENQILKQEIIGKFFLIWKEFQQEFQIQKQNQNILNQGYLMDQILMYLIQIGCDQREDLGVQINDLLVQKFVFIFQNLDSYNNIEKLVKVFCNSFQNVWSKYPLFFINSLKDYANTVIHLLMTNLSNTISSKQILQCLLHMLNTLKFYQNPHQSLTIKTTDQINFENTMKINQDFNSIFQNSSTLSMILICLLTNYMNQIEDEQQYYYDQKPVFYEQVDDFKSLSLYKLSLMVIQYLIKRFPDYVIPIYTEQLNQLLNSNQNQQTIDNYFHVVCYLPNNVSTQIIDKQKILEFLYQLSNHNIFFAKRLLFLCKEIKNDFSVKILIDIFDKIEEITDKFIQFELFNVIYQLTQDNHSTVTHFDFLFNALKRIRSIFKQNDNSEMIEDISTMISNSFQNVNSNHKEQLIVLIGNLEISCLEKIGFHQCQEFQRILNESLIYFDKYQKVVNFDTYYQFLYFMITNFSQYQSVIVVNGIFLLTCLEYFYYIIDQQKDVYYQKWQQLVNSYYQSLSKFQSNNVRKLLIEIFQADLLNSLSNQFQRKFVENFYLEMLKEDSKNKNFYKLVMTEFIFSDIYTQFKEHSFNIQNHINLIKLILEELYNNTETSTTQIIDLKSEILLIISFVNFHTQGIIFNQFIESETMQKIFIQKLLKFFEFLFNLEYKSMSILNLQMIFTQLNEQLKQIFAEEIIHLVIFQAIQIEAKRRSMRKRQIQDKSPNILFLKTLIRQNLQLQPIKQYTQQFLKQEIDKGLQRYISEGLNQRVVNFINN